MNTKKPLAVLLSAALALTLAACGAKTDSEPLPTATPEVTATTEPTATPEPTAEPAEEVTIHDFDIYVDAFKDENDIEITSTDDGTDIADTDALYVYLYNNGVTRQAVQADLDEGCDSPYIDGYLTYLDDLDKPSETPSKSLDDYEVAEDGEVIIDDWSSLVGGGSDSDVSVGSSGMEDIGDEVRKSVESGEAQRVLDEMKSRHPDWTI